ncbi:hypothetical protein Ciccas_007865 [Cichlidogyrus casuarinus]|uniref:Uncharacterized protein n=1 Tax=Cichlidogyrus casuarinus TaxID=1844966 RepID=A0ABD2Q2D3_9PLAT
MISGTGLAAGLGVLGGVTLLALLGLLCCCCPLIAAAGRNRAYKKVYNKEAQFGVWKDATLQRVHVENTNTAVIRQQPTASALVTNTTNPVTVKSDTHTVYHNSPLIVSGTTQSTATLTKTTEIPSSTTVYHNSPLIVPGTTQSTRTEEISSSTKVYHNSPLIIADPAPNNQQNTIYLEEVYPVRTTDTFVTKDTNEYHRSATTVSNNSLPTIHKSSDTFVTEEMFLPPQKSATFVSNPPSTETPRKSNVFITREITVPRKVHNTWSTPKTQRNAFLTEEMPLPSRNYYNSTSFISEHVPATQNSADSFVTREILLPPNEYRKSYPNTPETPRKTNVFITREITVPARSHNTQRNTFVTEEMSLPRRNHQNTTTIVREHVPANNSFFTRESTFASQPDSYRRTTMVSAEPQILREMSYPMQEKRNIVTEIVQASEPGTQRSSNPFLTKETTSVIEGEGPRSKTFVMNEMTARDVTTSNKKTVTTYVTEVEKAAHGDDEPVKIMRTVTSSDGPRTQTTVVSNVSASKCHKQ